MSSLSNKEISYIIVDYFKTLIDKKEVSTESADSLGVAIDCITDAFEIDGEVKPATTLKQLLSGAVVSTVDSSNSLEKVEVDETVAAKAEELKVEGNKYMGTKNFRKAIELYTSAIELNPANPIYYSNRAAAFISSKAMKKDLEAAKSKIQAAAKSTGGSTGGFPDLSGMMGGAGGNKGMMDMLMKDPNAMKKAQELMGNPDLMNKLMSNPNVMNMAQKFQSGDYNMADMMKDPAIQDMAKMFGR
ncbi:hypothetical protein HANVADRAFT_82161 [Hanseniaspora valbyensis NRRL Y-1626]|uniref:SGTA homodimerisation domain-containing protein n=1 Tax=Hanseniaspora valbyensis NRRL Y-1626 TaxID=766949 RepID=A0A1B7T908_9ASCO|nr:hypothetical protein HANVADRAFT_82161 [Hanseniaspora valbyensis NRRL Y-1626]